MDDIKELLSSLQAIESSGVAGIQNKAKLTAGRNGASLPLTSPVPATQKPRQPELGRLKRAFQAKGNENEVVPDNTQRHHPPFLSASDPIDALDLLEATDHLGALRPRELLAFLSSRGSVDGVTRENTLTEDGMDPSAGETIISELRALTAAATREASA